MRHVWRKRFMMLLLEEEDFMHITDYNRLSVLTFLGNAASQLTESVLIDIGKTVHQPASLV